MDNPLNQQLDLFGQPISATTAPTPSLLPNPQPAGYPQLSTDPARVQPDITDVAKVTTKTQALFDPQKIRYQAVLQLWTHVLEQCPPLRPDSNWDIHGPYNLTEGYLFFMPSQAAPLFKEIITANHQAFKVINPTAAAHKMSFFKKHSYFIKRPESLSQDDKQGYLVNYINRLQHKVDVLSARDSRGKLTAVQRIDLDTYYQQLYQFTRVLEQIENFELVVTNYFRDYNYFRVTYKVQLADSRYTNHTDYLRKHQTDALGQVLEYRYNFIFVDTQQIIQKHFYQHKVNEEYLKGFAITSIAALTKGEQLRLRPRQNHQE